jgi:uncharacterized membrane protein YsdA (DUF1294 family)
MGNIPFLVYIAFLAVMSLIAVILYYGDKKKAKKGAWRTPEATLLGFGFFGGAIGALIAMNTFRHKTKHWYFWVVNILGLAWQIALPIVILVLLK